MKSAPILANQGVRARILDDIALPAFYMQRHALELLIKRLLLWLYELVDFQSVIGEALRSVQKANREI